MDPEVEGDGFYVMIGTEHNLELYPSKKFEEASFGVPPGLLSAAELQDYRRVAYATASKVEIDRQGRILLPEKSLRRAHLGKALTLVGALEHLELWNRDEWEVFVKSRLPRVAELRAKAHEAFVKGSNRSG
jgi:MraZ protein